MTANCNGYVQIYINQTKRTYEHIEIAEIKLGRELLKGEVVHHIDENRSNNKPDNILVFKSRADHIRHHTLKPEEQELEELPNGSWICKNKKLIVVTCSICEKPFTLIQPKQVYCSMECSRKKVVKRKVERPSKEELYKLIWEKPSCLVAKDFGVNETSIVKWCKAYGIEKPPRGYWNRINGNKKQY